MNIAINASYLEGKRTGVGRYLSNILKYWSKNSPENNYYLYFKREIPKDEYLSAPCFIKKIIHAPEFLNRWIFWENIFLSRHIKKNKELDIFFSPAYTLPFFIGNIKKVVAVFDIFYTVHPEWVPLSNRYTLGLISKISSKQADVVLTASNFDKNDIVKYYKVPESKVKVIYLAAEDKFKNINNLENTKHVISKYGIKDKYVLCVGLIINRRVQDIIIRAFSRLNKEYKDASLVIIGQNKSYPYIDIEKEIENSNAKGNIKWIPYLPENEMTSFYSNASAFIYISLYEGESIPLKEAMAAGIPVITASILDEVVGDAGYIVKNPKDEEELKTAMKSVLSDNNLRDQMIRKGKKRADMFSWEKCAQETMGVLKYVCIQSKK
ncbi:MAG: glycosyltransferase family 1 protein [Elusimicrobia bacterium]|nr:glycosyltransferase family 1 protein [Elusimicrobiota bacterium]